MLGQTFTWKRGVALTAIALSAAACSTMQSDQPYDASLGISQQLTNIFNDPSSVTKPQNSVFIGSRFLKNATRHGNPRRYIAAMFQTEPQQATYADLSAFSVQESVEAWLQRDIHGFGFEDTSLQDPADKGSAYNGTSSTSAASRSAGRLTPMSARDFVHRVRHLRAQGHQVNGLSPASIDGYVASLPRNGREFGPVAGRDRSIRDMGPLSTTLQGLERDLEFQIHANATEVLSNAPRQRILREGARLLNIVFESTGDDGSLNAVSETLEGAYASLLDTQYDCRSDQEEARDGLSCRELIKARTRLENHIVHSAAGSYPKTFPVLGHLGMGWQSAEARYDASVEIPEHIQWIRIAQSDLDPSAAYKALFREEKSGALNDDSELFAGADTLDYDSKDEAAEHELQSELDAPPSVKEVRNPNGYALVDRQALNYNIALEKDWYLPFTYSVVRVQRPWLNTSVLGHIEAENRRSTGDAHRMYVSALVLACYDTIEECGRVTAGDVKAEHVVGYFLQRFDAGLDS